MAVAALVLAAVVLAAPSHGKPNKDVLMIAIDDMRPELGNYGCDHMNTPNIDQLAVESLVFDNAYVCVLTPLRADSIAC